MKLNTEEYRMCEDCNSIISDSSTIKEKDTIWYGEIELDVVKAYCPKCNKFLYTQMM